MLIPGNGGRGIPKSNRTPACEAVAAPSKMAENNSIFFIQRSDERQVRNFRQLMFFCRFIFE